MSQLAAVTPPPPANGEIIESVIAKGDLAKLTPQERTRYYVEVCKSVGLNPLTKPFEYINLNGKLTLYALRAASDQLRKINGVSIDELAETERDGVFVVTAKAHDKEGRTDIAKGAVSLTGLKGEALANAVMKAETKAKRRVTLSLCGLGWLDESEVDGIPGAKVGPPQEQPALQPVSVVAPVTIEAPHNPETGELSPHEIAFSGNWVEWGGNMIAAFKSATFPGELIEWDTLNSALLARCQNEAPKAHKSIAAAYTKYMAAVSQAPIQDAEAVLAEAVTETGDDDLPGFLRR